jgi:apolipoprotein D and lipocalin family protein
VAPDGELVLEAGRDAAVRIDDVGHAPVEAQQAPPRAVGRGDGLRRIRDEREAQLERAGELALAVEAITADADDLGVPRAQLRQGRLEPARFESSARGERLGEEVEHDPPAAPRREGERRPRRRLGRELRGLVTDSQHVAPVLLALTLLALLLGCATTATERLGLPPPATVPKVDLARYLGTWYEIASFPQRFQRGCTGTVATYALRSDGQIDVTNRCRDRALTGPERVARGRARVVDRATQAKLEVSFFGPFWGAYWIVALGDQYEWAVVGHPSRDYLWILSRTPRLDPVVYDAIVGRLAAAGFEVARLQRTTQPAVAGSR